MAESRSVLVTGATGLVGRRLVPALQAAGFAVRAVTRKPASAGLPAGVELVIAARDFTVATIAAPTVVAEEAAAEAAEAEEELLEGEEVPEGEEGAEAEAGEGEEEKPESE